MSGVGTGGVVLHRIERRNNHYFSVLIKQGDFYEMSVNDTWYVFLQYTLYRTQASQNRRIFRSIDRYPRVIQMGERRRHPHLLNIRT